MDAKMEPHPNQKMAFLLELRTANEFVQTTATGFVLRSLETAWSYLNAAVVEYGRTHEYIRRNQPNPYETPKEESL